MELKFIENTNDITDLSCTRAVFCGLVSIPIFRINILELTLIVSTKAPNTLSQIKEGHQRLCLTFLKMSHVHNCSRLFMNKHVELLESLNLIKLILLYCQLSLCTLALMVLCTTTSLRPLLNTSRQVVFTPQYSNEMWLKFLLKWSIWFQWPF